MKNIRKAVEAKILLLRRAYTNQCTITIPKAIADPYSINQNGTPKAAWSEKPDLSFWCQAFAVAALTILSIGFISMVEIAPMTETMIESIDVESLKRDAQRLEQ